MKQLCMSAICALALGASLSAQGATTSPLSPQSGPDLSGRWTREPVSEGADSAGWGSRIEIAQSGGVVTVRPVSGKPEPYKERYRLDGTETAEVLAVQGCKSQTRITKSLIGPDRVTITTWLVTKGACFHGEDDYEPLVAQPGIIEVRDVRGGPRRLESITVVFREGDALTVDTTRSNPGGMPINTTTTYRK